MSYNLFLDDERVPQHVTWCYIGQGPWVIVRNHSQFIETVMEHGIPAKVSFDHDLAEAHYTACLSGTDNYGPEPTGYESCKWLVDRCNALQVPFPAYTVHSMNPIGGQNIKSYIENAKKAGYIQ